MEKLNYKREIPLWILIAIPFIYILYVWNELPQRVPVHFDMSGTANNWGPKAMIFMMPVIHMATYLLLLYLPQIDPRQMTDEFFKTNFTKIRITISVFLFILSMIIIRMSLPDGSATPVVHLLPYIILLLLTVMGNFIINIKPNWFVGVRTPWTLSSDYVWKRTHQLLGRMWFYGGITSMLLYFALGDKWFNTIILVFALGTSAIAILYSFLLYKKEQSQKGIESD